MNDQNGGVCSEIVRLLGWFNILYQIKRFYFL
jgi:hypothetical protein